MESVFWGVVLRNDEMLVQRLPLSPHSKKFPGLNHPADWGLSVWSLHVLHVCVGFLQSKELAIRLTGFSKLHMGVNIIMDGCIYLLALDWRPVPKVYPALLNLSSSTLQRSGKKKKKIVNILMSENLRNYTLSRISIQLLMVWWSWTASDQ